MESNATPAPILTDDPITQDDLPPLVSAQHQESPMAIEPVTRTTVSFTLVKKIAQYLDIPYTDADKVIVKLFDSLVAAEQDSMRDDDE